MLVYWMWILFLIVAVVAIIATEVAYRYGLRASEAGQREAILAEVVTVQAAVLALFGLLLAFALSMAESRFSARRTLIINEANAIGTTWLRAGFLPDAQGTEARELLKRYLDTRIAFYNAKVNVSATFAAHSESQDLQTRLWALTEKVVRADLHSEAYSLYVESLNDMIDYGEMRVAALSNHVPLTIKVILIIAALISCAATGFVCGLYKVRTWLPMIILPALLGVSFLILLDLDFPRAGTIPTGQGSMLRLRESFKTNAHSPPKKGR
jgi:hypothetical protein